MVVKKPGFARGGWPRIGARPELVSEVAQPVCQHIVKEDVVEPLPSPTTGGLALADAPPRVQRKRTVQTTTRSRRRTLTIRHVIGHRIVALVEIVSPSNKDRPQHAEDFVAKVTRALDQGIHVTLVDLLPPGRHDPEGMDAAVWRVLDESGEPYDLPPEAPFTLATYVADSPIAVYLEHLAVGQTLPEMPLFLTPDYYVNLPLEPTYAAAFRGLPEIWREVLQALPSPPGSAHATAGPGS